MFLHDACHSIDSPDIAPILETVKFPNSSLWRIAMTVHATSFPTDQKVGPAAAEALLDVQQAVISADKATLDVDQAGVTFAAQENKRYTDLAASGSGSVQNAQQAQARIASAHAALARDNANLVSALKQVDLLKAEIVQANAALARAEALQRQAELNLGYTTITAPID